MYWFAHYLASTTDSLIHAVKNWIKQDIILNFSYNQYLPTRNSQAPDSMHRHHEIALGMDGLGVSKLKDDGYGCFQKI